MGGEKRHKSKISDRKSYERELQKLPMERPVRKDDQAYERPPMEDQTFVPEIY